MSASTSTARAAGTAGDGAAARRGSSAREALQGAMTAIAASGSDTPRLDAELLLAHVLEVDRERLLLDRELRVEGASVRAMQDAVRRRAIEHEPLAYITGVREFRHVQLAVDRRALVPRPETELLVERALALPPGASVLDVGTGSGAIALALKHERPDLEVSGSDRAEDALELARENGRRLGLDVAWHHVDLLDELPDEFDAVLANLPYVREDERQRLAPEIVRHEPPGALFAGADGLDAIRRLLAQLSERPRVEMVAVEVGKGQARTVAELTRNAGFDEIECGHDLAGIERVVTGWRKRP